MGGWLSQHRNLDTFILSTASATATIFPYFFPFSTDLSQNVIFGKYSSKILVVVCCAGLSLTDTLF